MFAEILKFILTKFGDWGKKFKMLAPLFSRSHISRPGSGHLPEEEREFIPSRRQREGGKAPRQKFLPFYYR
jgi:hypothetical protein